MGFQTLSTTASVGASMVTIPVREAVRAVSGELPGPPLTRHCWRGHNRAWIEVRGLDRPGGDELARVVLDAVTARPGVVSAKLNRPLSRLVVELDGDHVSLRELCRVVDAAETGRTNGERPKPLPGDGLLIATKAVAVGATAAGMGTALAGRVLRWPRLPDTVEAAVVAVDYQPRLRRLLEERIGQPATDTVLTLAMTAAHIISLAPASLAVDLMMEIVKAAECRAEAQAWRRHEPRLAVHADNDDVYLPSRPVPVPPGAAERHAQRVALAQAVGAGVVGAAARSVNMAGTAALVTAPKALRTTRESFAAALGQGLSERHGVLPLRPHSLRRLDQVDALLVDPRVLCTDKLRVVRVRGARDDELAEAWERAQSLLDDADAGLGWHRVPGGRGRRVEALICPTHDPLAPAVMAEARRCGVDLISVDTDALGELRPAFDEVRPLDVGSLDDALADALAHLQRDGHTVAVLSSAAAQALSSADVALGLIPRDDTQPPPWYADLLLPDLAGVWRVLHALPAAKSATRRGIEISTGASALGALLMLPGVRGRGPGPVTTGAAAGLLSGYWLARGVVNAATPRPAPVQEWHAMTVEQVRRELPPPAEPDVAKPSRAVATAQRGAEITARPGRAVWNFVKAVRAELSDPLTPVLALGSAASAVLGSPVDAVLVGSVLTGNAVLAASQRLRAESRLNQLLALQIPPARKVTADGYVNVKAAQLRPGDVIEVRTHEVVPADARLIEEEDLEVDESTLTGESLPVEKQTEPTPGVELADRRCMVFAGTTVVAGTALAVVTAVGADTQARRAAELASGELPDVGLQHQLSQLTNRAFPVSMAGGVLVSALGMLRRKGLRQAVASGIAVTVAAVPEGMPLVATLAQAASARRLTNYGALVRIPRSVEALGRVDVVCFDKTGTLSENRLRVSQVHPVAGHSREDVLHSAAHAAPTANGNPHVHATDRAIIEAAQSVNGSAPTDEPDAHLPFRSGRSFSASVSGDLLTVKGAPEVVLRACQNGAADMDRTVRGLAGEGLRVIAVARRQLTAEQARAVQDDEDAIDDLCRDGLSLTGFLGLSDTPRAQAPGLLADLAERNTAIRLITGDHPITATAIAAELGMPVTPEQVITGAEWDELSRKDQERAVAERVIFARMSPENKVQIVQTLERTGKVCAMVGDGSNDAAAIRAATVGIAVVARGSDPASVAADVVLVDGRIEALLNAIEEGRELWRRVQAAVSVLLGGNAGEVGFAIIGSALTGSSPLDTRQLLLVNMLTDALPAAALAVSQTTGSGNRDARGPDQQALWRAVAIRGTTTAAAATAAWAMAGVTGRPRRASTVALVALVSAQLGQTLLDSHAPLVVLTAGGSLVAMGTLISIPGVSQLLGCTPLGPIGWAQGLGSAAVATAAVAAAPRLLFGQRSDSDQPEQPPEHRPATAPRTTRSPEPSTRQRARKLADRPEHRSSTYLRQ
ncbi:haloacid dehalogenase [Mycobacterium kyorinense]|uniref:Haloacid dehalogenase n=1 Tax=Mycobacterium kyorinense TaxID=487514 RepID=A0A1X1XQI3_9MYCO|nr:haloacid dehalogenase [Mycobacterium kyorinense]